MAESSLFAYTITIVRSSFNFDYFRTGFFKAENFISLYHFYAFILDAECYQFIWFEFFFCI